MNRRQVLAGLTAGIPLFAGCSMLASENNATGNDTQPAGKNETNQTKTATPTSTETTVAETVQEMATQTATATPTPTQTPTSTPTATPTQTTPTNSPTATPKSFFTSVPATQGTPGTTSEAPAIDPSNLTTYTSGTYPYSVKYPAGWTIDETVEDGDVKFDSGSVASMLVQVTEDVPPSVTPDRVAALLIRTFKQGEKKVTDVSQRTVTLPNGNSATIIEMSFGNSLVSIRLSTLISIVDGRLYTVTVFVPEFNYTPTVEQAVNEILTSLTISETATTTPRLERPSVTTD